MNNIANLVTGMICYILSVILTFYYLILEFSILDVTSPIARLKIIMVVIFLMYLGGFFLKRTAYTKFKNLSKMNMWIWFIIYVIMLLNLTLFDKYFGRGITLNISDATRVKDYFTYNFNIIPFATINNYFLAFKNNNLSNLNFIYNIFGNLLVFAPMALFLPRQFPKINKWYKFFLITSIIIILIEFLQMLTMSGSFDVDDYILNIIGAIITYILINNVIIKKYLDKFIYLEY